MKNKIETVGGKRKNLIRKPNQITNNSRNGEKKLLGVKIQNNLGENNCFVNVIIHLLYNCNDFKELLKSKILNAKLLIHLKEILNKYEEISLKNDNGFINPEILRKELNELSNSKGKFKLNEMGDPIEILLIIMDLLHSENLIKSKNTEGIILLCQPKCIPHKIFHIDLLSQDECECGMKAEAIPYDPNNFIYEIYAIQLLDRIKNDKSINIFKSLYVYLKIKRVNQIQSAQT